MRGAGGVSTGSGWMWGDLALLGPTEVKRDVRCCRAFWGFGVVCLGVGDPQGWDGGLWRNGRDRG